MMRGHTRRSIEATLIAGFHLDPVASVASMRRIAELAEEHDAEHDDIQAKFRRVLADPRLPLRDRVRMACSFGAAFAGLFMSGDAFEGTPNQELGDLLREAVRDVLAG